LSAIRTSSVRADFALVHDALLVVMDVFDRVFDRDDVALALVVDEIDHRGQGRRLAAARRAADEHEALLLAAEVLHRGGQPERLEGADLERDLADRRRNAATLQIDVGAESGQSLDPEREVQLLRGFEPDALLIGEHAVDERSGGIGSQHLGVARMDRPIDAELRGHSRRDVQVGRLLGDHCSRRSRSVSGNVAPLVTVTSVGRVLQHFLHRRHAPLQLRVRPFERQHASSIAVFFNSWDGALEHHIPSRGERFMTSQIPWRPRYPCCCSPGPLGR
jgi:hypothetical protein